MVTLSFSAHSTGSLALVTSTARPPAALAAGAAAAQAIAAPTAASAIKRMRPGQEPPACFPVTITALLLPSEMRRLPPLAAQAKGNQVFRAVPTDDGWSTKEG